MSITKEEKTQLIAEFGLSEGDTGSTEVQVALLTKRIRSLTEHLKMHKKDHASRRGLLKLVGRRAALLKYLARTARPRYLNLVQRLGIRRKN